MILNYTSIGEAIPDIRITQKLMGLKSKSRSEKLNVSNFLVLRVAQVLIAEGKLDPIDVTFMIEGRVIHHDAVGHLYDVPDNHTNPLHLLEQRFDYGALSRTMERLTASDKQKLNAIRVSWFQTNIAAVITVKESLEFDDRAPKEMIAFFEDFSPLASHDEPSKLYRVNANRKRFLDPAEMADDLVVTCCSWVCVSTQTGVIEPAVMTDKGIMTIAELVSSAYDKDGEILVLRPFNLKEALVTAGISDNLTLDTRFDLTR